MHAPTEERRIATRFPIRVELKLLAPAQHLLLLSHTLNLSLEGALVRAGREIPVGTRVQVSLFRDELHSPLQLEAEVVRLAGGGGGRVPGIGLRFAVMSDVDRNTLIGIIERRGHNVADARV
ncbi:MAG: PilZ domain-containing protein [Nannocystaceae bacterium]